MLREVKSTKKNREIASSQRTTTAVSTGQGAREGHGAAVLGRIAQNKVPDLVVIDLMKDFTYYRELTRTLPYSDLTAVRQLLLTTCRSHGNKRPRARLELWHLSKGT